MRFKRAADMLKTFFPSEASFTNSTFIARLNGLLKGFGTLQHIHQEIKLWNIPGSSKHILLDMMQRSVGETRNNAVRLTSEKVE
ncbi:hypothetical protein BA724_00545 [Domibacillus iocasae]|uniref:Uncharacterized protein n=1 Tax=Domibacillus iocasae TaxID=1714016 RepID=A0A1E7DU31_9BACI|nr:hypothetical protein BA724_00545 [Domibacillus iocasae]